ncbi:MAG TPA: hypothetical protein VML55_07980 [Planctomycetaceae bacterium]|nr:hypothetical protein [Planctomycetaceae bacterium]
MAAREQDIRLDILNTLLTTPHRELDRVWPVHREMVEKDPLFYVRLAAWYADHGDVRDHKEMFVVTLCLSDFEGHRDTGLALLRGLPPYELVRVIDFIHGRKTTRTVRVADKTKRREKARNLFRTANTRKSDGESDAAAAAAEPQVETKVVEFGLFKNVPRSVKTEVARYLSEREADPDWFDSTALVARKALKRLYAVLHIRPGARAQQILFDKEPPPGSRLYALRELAHASSPADQARAIVEHRIPYRVAATVVRQMTPTVLLALIERMSPQELINNLGSLTRRGAFDNADLKALIDEKLAQARTAGRVSAFKTEEAARAAGVSADVRQQLEAIADTQVKARGRITRPTALLVDKSGSMEQAIELGKRIGAMVSAICEKELYVYAFDTMAYEVPAQGGDMAAWERAFRGIRAGGGTSCGVALAYLRKKKHYVEQIVLVTDEGENTPPLFLDELRQYREELKADPGVCIVRTSGGQPYLERQCRQAGVLVDVFQFSGDYYALPNLVPMLTRPSKLELLMEIMEYPLPVRKPG